MLELLQGVDEVLLERAVFEVGRRAFLVARLTALLDDRVQVENVASHVAFVVDPAVVLSTRAQRAPSTPARHASRVVRASADGTA